MTYKRIIIPMFLVLLFACKPDKENNDVPAINRTIFYLMQQNYLWKEHLPANVNYSAYASPDDFMNMLRYNVYDRWSFVMTKEEYRYFSEGTMFGHGLIPGLDKEGRVRVALIYPTTQAYAQGVRRGWIFSEINGNIVTRYNIYSLLGPSETDITNTITFINESGLPVTKTLTKEEITISPVVHYEVIEQNDSQIGYLVFQDFIDLANDQLDEAFDTFSNRGIDEIIIDLRYNGGGAVNVALHLSSLLIGKDFGNLPFVKLRYNDDLASEKNVTVNLPSNPDGLSLGRIFFIGSDYTASASELLITGVSPYVQSVLTGSATEGKPAGMDGWELIGYDYLVFPITFEYYNANDEGEFYNGLVPQIFAEDDVTKDFGDPEEDCLRAILEYIDTGMIPTKTWKSEEGSRTMLCVPDVGIGQFRRAL
jgi:C-terminal processing protease CtpA/Prc